MLLECTPLTILTMLEKAIPYSFSNSTLKSVNLGNRATNVLALVLRQGIR